jgi:rubrerythrin
MNPDLSNDEVQRQLREARRAQEASAPLFARALRRAFDPSSGASLDDKAQLVGVPRRALLSAGALLGAGVVLAACGSSDDDQLPVTGSIPAVPEDPTTTAPGSEALDLVVLNTARSIELLAVDVYGQALDSDLLETRALVDTAELFRDQHEEHAEALSAAVRQLGGRPVTEANQYLLENEVAPLVAELTDETTVVELALALETTAAATYVKTTPTLTTPELRQAAMSVGGVEARHVAILHNALQMVPVPVAFFRTSAAAPELAYVDE